MIRAPDQASSPHRPAPSGTARLHGGVYGMAEIGFRRSYAEDPDGNR